jgi:hypothetical protein
MIRPTAVAPLPAPKPAAAVAMLPTEAEMRAQLQGKLAAIEAQLVADTEASLDVAVARALVSRS